MALDELVDQLGSSKTTRRSIVKKGAKLTYAAPLVAASFKLRSMDASAQAVSQNCPCGSDCGDSAFDCFCLTDGENVAFCSNNFFCGTTDPCTSNDDCPDGWICQGGRCPGNCGSVCVPPCGTTVTSSVRVQSNGLTNRGG